MKVKCIKDNTDYVKGGLFGIGEKLESKIDGLTKNKTYNAEVISHTQCSGYGTTLSVESEIVFFIFNDDEQWQAYNPDLFVPADL